MMTTLADCSSLRRFDIDSRTNLTVFSRSRIDSQLARGKSSHLSEIIKVHRVAGRIRVTRCAVLHLRSERPAAASALATQLRDGAVS